MQICELDPSIAVVGQADLYDLKLWTVLQEQFCLIEGGVCVVFLNNLGLKKPSIIGLMDQ